MAEDILKVERHPNYVTITLNRPEKRNSLNEALLASMDKAFASIETDKEIRAVILRGEGKSFCAGLDLAEADRLEGGHWIRRVHDTVDRRRVMVQGGQAQQAKMEPIFARLRRSTREVLARYSEDQLDLIADFLRRTAAVAAQHRQRLRRS